MNKIKKRFDEYATLTRVHIQKDKKELSFMKMMTKEQKQLMGIKKTNKKKEQIKMAFYYKKLLENGLMKDKIKCIRHIHLQHHPIGMDIKNNLNIMHHRLTPTINYHAKLQMKRKCILELKI
jgi:hypothetical protein